MMNLFENEIMDNILINILHSLERKFKDRLWGVKQMGVKKLFSLI